MLVLPQFFANNGDQSCFIGGKCKAKSGSEETNATCSYITCYGSVTKSC